MKISIITVNKNNLDGLRKTAESIIRNRILEFEWVVIDGNSTDGSVSYLKSIEDNLDKWISESDGGIYDAMNKGLKMISSDYCWFLNSGDIIYNDYTLANVSNILSLNNQVDIFIFDYVLYRNGVEKKITQTSELDFSYLIKKTINHQSYIVKAKHLLEFPFETRFKIISDWIQMFEILKNNNNNNIICMKVSIPIVVYDGNGFSYINESKRIKERKYYLNTLYSNWELSSLEQHARLRTKPYFKRLLYSLDSPKRTLILDYVLKLLYFFTR